MTYAELDFNLTDEQLATRDMVRRFGAEVVRPGGIELDKLPSSSGRAASRRSASS